MGEPYEILVSPYELYKAPYGEAWPDVDTTPGGNWILIGTNGKCNYSEDGVTVNHEQTIVKIFTLCSTLARKAIRTQEMISVALTLLDATLEQVRYALNDNVITEVAAGSGTPGYKSIELRRGQTVATYALLVKGMSPYGDGYYGQYQIPLAFQSGNMSLVYNKGSAVGVAMAFEVLEDPNAATEEERAGKLVLQNAAALP